MSDYFEDIVEIDNFISPRYAEHLKQTVMDSKFPWYFNRDITSPLWFWEQNHLNDSTLDVEESSFTGFMHIGDDEDESQGLQQVCDVTRSDRGATRSARCA